VPTYSYACQECGHAFDIRQSFSDDSLTVCPECGAPRLRKVIHPVGISFKGSGFYKTDSRASAKSGTGSNGSGSSSSDGGTKTETAASTSSSDSPSPAPAGTSSASSASSSTPPSTSSTAS
jgi:putative FmdB family regulatory protein